MVKVLVISISIIQMLAIQLNLEVQFENLFDQLSRLVPSSEPNVEQFKTALVNSCYQCPNHEANFSQFIATEQNEALRDLSYNKQILISRPDKGSGIEGQQQQQQQNGQHIVRSYQFFKTTHEKDQTTAIEKTIYELLVCMKKDEKLDPTIFERIQPTSTIIPGLYDLPRIHKKDATLRPISCMVNSQ